MMRLPLLPAPLRRAGGWLRCVLVVGVAGGLALAAARGAAVSETATELITSGAFNSDTNTDLVVVDKTTGVARVGYLSAAGAITWSSPLVSGVEGATAITAGALVEPSLDGLAVTAPGFNRIHLLSLGGTNAFPAPIPLAPVGVGPHGLVSLRRPAGSMAQLVVATGSNGPPAQRLDLLLLSGVWPSSPTLAAQPAESGRFERGNGLPLGTNGPVLVAGLVRSPGSDALHVWQFTNAASLLVSLEPLPPGTEYAAGWFNGEALPRFWTYQPGTSNLLVRPLTNSATAWGFGPALSLSFTQAVRRVDCVAAAGGTALVQFDDGIRGVRLSGSSALVSPRLAPPAGTNFTGVASLDGGRFTLLSAGTGQGSSSRAQVMGFDGTNFTQLSASSLPAANTRNTRATVWLFASDPFTNAAASLVASVSVPDWSTAVLGLPLGLSVQGETDAGTNAGLGLTSTTSLGTPPAGANFGLPDQYRSDVSWFRDGPPRPAEPAVLEISPPPGTYAGPLTLSFLKQGSANVFYRTNPAQAWLSYALPFVLGSSATVEFYGQHPLNAARGSLQSARYRLTADAGPPPAPLILTNQPGVTNPPPSTPVPGRVPISVAGTALYGRRTAAATRFFGPTPYLSRADVPYATNGMRYYHVEDFEDGLVNTPGLGLGAGWVVSTGGATDSVDADDGTLDGSGSGGHSLYSARSFSTLSVTFDRTALDGRYPTHAGVVWTDVGVVAAGPSGYGDVILTAYDANGVMVGSVTGAGLGDGSTFSGTAEDRFLGVFHPGGLSAITFRMPNSGDWEIDHVQYGYLPDPGAIWAINLDGTSETLVTTGARPRASRDGEWLAFLREGDGLQGEGNLWLRHLPSGFETRAIAGASRIVGYDWMPDNQTLVLDLVRGGFQADFNRGVPPGSSIPPGPAGDPNEAVVEGGYLKLTSAVNGAAGIYYIHDFGGGQWVRQFTARFKAYLFGSTCCNNGLTPADGFSFNLAPASAVVANPGGSQPAEEGLDAGLAINFDTYDNGGGEGPAIEVKWRGTVVARRPYQPSRSPAGATTPAQAEREVRIRLDEDGTLDVSYGADVIFTNLPTGYNPSLIGVPKWVLGARTGAANDNHWIDDLSILAGPNAACGLHALSLCGGLGPLAAPAVCGDEAPGANPVTGKVASQNLDPAEAGIFLAQPGLTNRSRLSLPATGARWPMWSPDGSRLVVADGPANRDANAGRNLWLAAPDNGWSVKLTELQGAANGFPHGAVWVPNASALVAAGGLFNTNGLWVLPLSADGTRCEGVPVRLPLSAGGDVDFAGTVLMPPPYGASPPPPPALTVLRLGEELTVRWCFLQPDARLEAASSLSAPVWQAVDPELIQLNGVFYEYQRARLSPPAQQFFRLRRPVSVR